RRGEHLPRGVAVLTLTRDRYRVLCRSGQQSSLLGVREPQEEGDREDERALDETEGLERGAVAGVLDHVGDRDHRQRGARAEAGGSEPDGKAAPVREPL